MIRSTFSTEEQLLLLCCSSMPAGSVDFESEGIAHNTINWEKFINLSAEYMVSPLVYTRLKELHSLHPPSHVIATLEEAYSSSESSYLLYSLELKNLLQLFNMHDIRAIPLKGPLLAETFYDDPCQRINTDLDILIPKERIGKAIEILSREDFRIIEEGNKALGLENDMRSLDMWKTKEPHYLLELHWNPCDSRLCKIPEDLVWGDAREQFFQGVQTLVLSPEMIFIYTLIHVCQHRFHLKWLLDLDRVLRKYVPLLDWKSLANTSNRLGITNLMICTNRMANKFLRTELPDIVLDKSNSGKIKHKIFYRPLEKNFFHHPKETHYIQRAYLCLLLDGFIRSIRALTFFIWPYLSEEGMVQLSKGDNVNVSGLFFRRPLMLWNRFATSLCQKQVKDKTIVF